MNKELQLLAHALLGLTEIILSQMDMMVTNYFRQPLLTDQLIQRADIIRRLVSRLNDDFKKEEDQFTHLDRCHEMISSIGTILSTIEEANQNLILFMKEGDDDILDQVEKLVKQAIKALKQFREEG